jgi:putative spermidine/putrescine transport system ATP-binding protein
MAIQAENFRELKLQGVSRDFGSVSALRDVNLTIRKGEFIALLGPSGCGKSTTLNILAGLLPATAGGIWLDEKRIDTLPPEDRGFGMVFQNYALFPHMTVRRNIGFGLAMRRVPTAEAERRIDEAVKLVRLQGHENKLPGQLSGGQQQRVAIARAIVIEPPLVLMDEPLSNLDAKLRLEMRAEIRRIHSTLGATTVYVTHDQEEALSLADRIVVMRDGEVRQVGKPEELFAKPRHVDIAQFMGFRNVLKGRVISVEGLNATVDVGQTLIQGFAHDALAVGQSVLAAIRPEDMRSVSHGESGLGVQVVSSEFRGREFFGFGTASDGTEISFGSARALMGGEQIQVRPMEGAVALYAQEGV